MTLTYKWCLPGINGVWNGGSAEFGEQGRRTGSAISHLQEGFAAVGGIAQRKFTEEDGDEPVGGCSDGEFALREAPAK
jgi:hypothetical protein